MAARHLSLDFLASPSLTLRALPLLELGSEAGQILALSNGSHRNLQCVLIGIVHAVHCKPSQRDKPGSPSLHSHRHTHLSPKHPWERPLFSFEVTWQQ